MQPRIWALVALVVGQIAAMQLDPERIAARLRIEAEEEMDRIRRVGRNRRDSAQPKEVTIQVTAPLFSSRLFEHGPEAKDTELPKSLDVAQKVQLRRPIPFYGQQYSTVFILSNGAIAFDSSPKAHTAKVLPSNLKLIAPYWNRNDLRNGGRVFFREITESSAGRVLERGQSEIRYQYDKNVKALSCLLVTWDRMQPMGVTKLPDTNTNTFQAAIFVTTNGTFANFIYSNIGWTQAAEAGFSGGDGVEHFALPTSGSSHIMYLEESGNTGIPGEWMFELAEKRIVRCKPGIKGDTCDAGCDAGEWGADCAGCCHCEGNGACDNVNGVCERDSCADCWMGANCQQKSPQCRDDGPRKCATNAISLTDMDRCGDPMRRCQCLDGFEGDGRIQCHDIDECAQPGRCHPDAVCTNTPGHYFCQCADGFSGDGVKECSAVSSFLFPHDAQPLPIQKNSQISFPLRSPLVIFGRERREISISTMGLITLEPTSVTPNIRLDDTDVIGLAPFFGPIDLSQRGEVTVSESGRADLLARATQLVNDNLQNGDFIATDLVIISFMNVSAASGNAKNTFQCVLIGGRNGQKQAETFVQFLYKDLIWSEGAEAGIMTADKTASIQLPGSGTEGIEQLSALSNIRVPGVWLYRVDREAVSPCMEADLQPPYCDARSPPLLHKRPQAAPAATTTTSAPKTTEKARTPARAETTPARAEKPPAKPEPPQFDIQTIVPDLLEPLDPLDDPTLFSVEPEIITPAFVPTVSTTPAATRPKPAESTTRQPLVSFKSKELELPPDVFEPSPAFVTVPAERFDPTNVEEETTVSLRTVSVEIMTPEPPTTPPATAATTTTTLAAVEPDLIDSNRFPQPPEEEIPLFQKKPTTVETIVAAETQKPIIHPVITDSPTPETPNIFTTPRSAAKKTSQASAKPKLVTGMAKEGVDVIPFDQNRVLDAEMAGSRFAIVIPVGVVVLWIVILVTFAVCLCCRRRRAHHQLRTMYGPAYQIRPMPSNYSIREGGMTPKHFEGIYEEHMEKRMQDGYHGNGRISLYGSYWNLTNSSASRSGVEHLPHL